MVKQFNKHRVRDLFCSSYRISFAVIDLNGPRSIFPQPSILPQIDFHFIPDGQNIFWLPILGHLNSFFGHYQLWIGECSIYTFSLTIFPSYLSMANFETEFLAVFGNFLLLRKKSYKNKMHKKLFLLIPLCSNFIYKKNSNTKIFMASWQYIVYIFITFYPTLPFYPVWRYT